MRHVAISLVILILTACATRSALPINSDFSPPTVAEIARSFELRDRYSLPKHLGVTAVYVDSVAVHHLYSEASTILWKDGTGKWQRSQVFEIGPGGLLPVERKLESQETTSLGDAEAQRLERLIRDRELYSGQVRRTGQVGIGAPFHVMSIVTSFGRTTVKWDGRLRGKNGAVANLVLGHD